MLYLFPIHITLFSQKKKKKKGRCTKKKTWRILLIAFQRKCGDHISGVLLFETFVLSNFLSLFCFFGGGQLCFPERFELTLLLFFSEVWREKERNTEINNYKMTSL